VCSTLQWANIALQSANITLQSQLQLQGKSKQDLVKPAEIDTSIFKAHSIQSPATSAAAHAGVSVKEIMKTAVWTSESVLEKLYYIGLHGPPSLATQLSIWQKLT